MATHTGDECSEAAASLDDALVEQVEECAARSDRRDAELVTHLAQRGAALTLLELTGLDAATDLIADANVLRDVGAGTSAGA